MARPGVATAFKLMRTREVQRTGSTRTSNLTSGGGGGGFQRFQPPTIPGGGLPFTPGGGGIPGLPGGGTGGPIGGLCDLLPAGVLRETCKIGGSFIPGGGGGGGGDPLAPPSGSGPCPAGTVRVGANCISPGDAFPGGDPLMFPAGGNTVPGGFGMPAVTPTLEQRTVHECPTGFVLGKDNLCYPKQLLSRRSRFRKWKGDPRPPVTASDAKAIRTAERVRGKVKNLAKDVNLKVTGR